MSSWQQVSFFVRITSEKLSNEHWQMLSDPILSSERLQKNTEQDNYSKDHKYHRREHEVNELRLLEQNLEFSPTLVPEDGIDGLLPDRAFSL